MEHADQSVTNSVTNSWINGPNIQIGSVGGNVVLAVDRPDYQLHWLAPAAGDVWVPQRQRTPSHLLDARQGVVPYRPRPAVQKQLLAWRDAPNVPMSVLLLHGAGGLGKTRLANAFAGQAHLDEWAVAHAIHRATALPALVTDTGSPSAPSASTAAVTDKHGPMLVAVDYAERWNADALVQLIIGLPADFPGRVIRVLLLARSQIDLWPQLQDQLDRAPTELEDPIELGNLTSSTAERLAAFTDAADAFRSRLEFDVQGLAAPDLSDPAYGSPLILHMTALAAVCAARDHEPRPELSDLSDYLLRHEGRFWPGDTPDPRTGVTRRQAADSVFLATLFGPLDDATSACVLLEHAQVASAEAARAVLTWHDRLYPEALTAADRTATTDQPALAPLRPDRFGEDFVATHLRKQPRTAAMLAQVLEPAAHQTVPEQAAVRRCLIVLAAAADRHEHTQHVLWSLLLQHAALARHASAPLIQTLIRHAPRNVATTVANALPPYRSDLLRSALQLARHLVDTLPVTASDAERAILLNNLGVQLAHAGDKQAALTPAREATNLYRRLAEADPAAYLPNLAASLSNLGNQLAEAGHKQAALTPAREATNHYRRLAEADPATHLPNLALSCCALAWGQVQKTGQPSAAVNGARILTPRRRMNADPLVAIDL